VALTALIMAGGEATRMHHRTEKPLLEVGGKPMIQHVHEILRRSRVIDRIVVAISENTPRTAAWAQGRGVEVIETPGEGYHRDMRHAIKKLGLKGVLVVSADLPFLTTEVIKRAARTYASSRKPSVTVMAPLQVYKELRLTPSYVFETHGRSLVPIGVNIIDGRRIDEAELDQTVIITRSKELTLNVNTPAELIIANRRVKGRRRPNDE
jgi:adenosylcobinamide-phosphate guanylyltransferase